MGINSGETGDGNAARAAPGKSNASTAIKGIQHLVYQVFDKRQDLSKNAVICL